jgi:hypothetical protein
MLDDSVLLGLDPEMVLVGGKDRTLEEVCGLAREAGLEPDRIGRQRSGRVLVQFRPA